MESMYKLADGTYDYLPEECYNLDELKRILLDSFTIRGYRKIDTPTFERYDLFSKGVGYIPSQKLFKLTDSDGSLMVLRPDMTMPIARIVNTKMKGVRNAKFCYVSNSYSFKHKGNAMREFTQAGVEVISECSAYVDADVIALAITALLNAGLKNFQIDIGNVGFFKGLLSELRLAPTLEEELIKLVDVKDAFGLEMFAKEHSIDKTKLDAILGLPTLFGSAEVLDRAAKMTKCKEALDAIDNLKAIYSILCKYALDKYVSFDLSLVNGISYYSGVVFTGITRYFGAPILGGGRYDGLSSSFGGDTPSTGFAIGVNNLASALRKESGSIRKLPDIDVLVGGDESAIEKMLEYIDTQLSYGLIVENSYARSIDALKELAGEKSAKRAVFFKSGGEGIEVL